MLKSGVAAIAMLLPATLTAQQAVPCDWPARADAIVEPWEDHTRTFANGAVRLALLDTVEPAAGSVHILILSPPYSEMGERQCMTLGMGDGVGFSDVNWETLFAEYQPGVGLVFTVGVRAFNGEEFRPAALLFSLNQSTGEIAAGFE